jgi:hypothetical protein
MGCFQNAEGVPAHVKSASFVWQRGNKLQYTGLSGVTHPGGLVYWDKSLKQVI